MDDTLLRKVETVIQVLSEVSNNIKENTISKDSRLLELGVNSIQYMTMILKLEEKFNIEFEEKVLIPSKLPTISDVAEYINKREKEK